MAAAAGNEKARAGNEKAGNSIVTASTQPQLKLRVTKYLVGPPPHPPTTPPTTTFKALPDKVGS